MNVCACVSVCESKFRFLVTFRLGIMYELYRLVWMVIYRLMTIFANWFLFSSFLLFSSSFFLFGCFFLFHCFDCTFCVSLRRLCRHAIFFFLLALHCGMWLLRVHWISFCAAAHVCVHTLLMMMMMMTTAMINGEWWRRCWWCSAVWMCVVCAFVRAIFFLFRMHACTYQYIYPQWNRALRH